MLKLALAAAAAATVALPAQALTTGDLAFTGFNADKDYWSVVALTDIAPNTQVFFSDNEWNGSAFNDTNEHTLVWNTGAEVIAAGTVVLFTEIDAATDTITASIGTLGLAAGGGTGLGLSATADTLYAYLGAAVAPTTFLAAISSEASATNMTNAGLVVGVNAVKLTSDADYGEYTGIRAGQTSFAAYGALVNNSANWNILVGGDQAALVPSTVAFTVTPVPEASTTAMLLAGLAAMGFVARRRA